MFQPRRLYNLDDGPPVIPAGRFLGCGRQVASHAIGSVGKSFPYELRDLRIEIAKKGCTTEARSTRRRDPKFSYRLDWEFDV